jgi:hypothetical protein
MPKIMSSRWIDQPRASSSGKAKKIPASAWSMRSDPNRNSVSKPSHVRSDQLACPFSFEGQPDRGNFVYLQIAKLGELRTSKHHKDDLKSSLTIWSGSGWLALKAEHLAEESQEATVVSLLKINARMHFGRNIPCLPTGLLINRTPCTCRHVFCTFFDDFRASMTVTVRRERERGRNGQLS